MRVENTEVKVVEADVTELKVDAIVNAANNKLLMGGGVAGAIKRKGGQVIEDEASKKSPIKIGEATFTSAGRLSAKYIIHAATMGMNFQTDEIKIRNSCMNSLKLADELNIKSIAFPALGCGTGGFPLLASAKIMAQEALKHIRYTKTGIEEIIFCLYDKEAYQVFHKGVLGYLNHFVNDLGKGPFVTIDAIIEIDGGILVIERSNPPFGLALPGGFVDYGESLEVAITREVKEETGLDVVELKQFHTYSDPTRDPRFHTIGTVFIVKAKGTPEAGDDAAAIKIIKPSEVEKLNFAFDHKKIIKDWLSIK